MGGRFHFPTFVYPVHMKCFVAPLAMLLGIATAPAQQEDRYQAITSAVEQNRFAEAEKGLRDILKSSPGDLRALSLLGIVLDSEGRYQEAEDAYERAIKLAPDSAPLLNNIGNHYLARGDAKKARNSFEKVLTREPDHANANLQLARLAVDQKDFPVALRCLTRLPQPEQQEFAVRLLQLRALWGSGQKPAAEALLGDLEREAPADLRYRFALAMAFVSMERFVEAEGAFAVVLQSDPANFDVLYNLGMSALRAGHTDRATEVFERALQVRPGDVDTMVGLSRALILGRKEPQALPLLVRAHNLAQDRPDILLLMAQTSYDEGFFADTAIAYEKYLKLRPDDEIARRERALALTRSFRVREGLKDLEAYVKKHPKDPWGYYKLAAAQSLEDKEQSLVSINKVLELSPGLKEARYARGLLLLQLNRTEEAVAEFGAYLAVDPDNAQALEQMGRALLKLNQPEPAAEYLRKAIAKNPADGNLYFQLSRALRALGRTNEMAEALAKFQQLGGAKEKTVPAPGLFEYLSLDPDVQAKRDEAALKQAIEQRPSDLELKITLAELLFRQKRTADALALVTENFRPGAVDLRLLARLTNVLLGFEQYSTALPLLEPVLKAPDSTEDLSLDYAQAKFRTSGAAAALAALDEIPNSRRSGNYYLLKAQLLDELGRFSDAVAALNLALSSAPTRSDLYFQACSFLIKHRRFQECLQLLEQAERRVPDSPDLALARAVVLQMMNQATSAAHQLSKIEARWPEWPTPYLVHGIILEGQHQAKEAKQLLESAIALGSSIPAAYFHLALAMKDLAPNDNENAYQVISRGVELAPDDPYMQMQAGKIALDMKNYPSALAHLREAIRLYPEMADAHWLLANFYRLTNQQDKVQTELAEVARLNKLFPPGTQTPPSMQDLLFSLRKPGAGGAER